MSAATTERFTTATERQVPFHIADPPPVDFLEQRDFIIPSIPNSEIDRRPSANLAEKMTAQAQDDRFKARPIRLRDNQVPQRRFELLQQFEGAVTEVENDSFWAELLDLTNRSNPPEFVELLVAEIPIADRELIAP